jgi:ATP-dependent DNA helicase RecQ
MGMLKVLEVEGAVYRDGSVWHRSAQRWVYPEQRVAAVTAQRKAEQATMQRYLDTDECLMRLLRMELDDDSAAACGRCSNCTGKTLPVDLQDGLLAAATEFLKRTDVPITPRKRWPYKFGGPPLKDFGLAAGKALTVWGDPGLARLVKNGKYDTGRFDDRLVDALAELATSWAPEPRPTWITWVPAFGGGGLVADLALRLGERLDLPVRGAVTKSMQNRPQREMENSYHQADNVRGAFSVEEDLEGHVLLVDDTVDSKWTFTVIGSLLRKQGVETVYPVALADTSRSS